MRVAIFGNKGSMGTRYSNIIRFLGNQIECFDIDNQFDFKKCNFDRAIVATPTSTHYDIVKKLIDFNIPILCEKPVCFFPNKIKELIDLDVNSLVDVVCNWKFVRGMIDYAGYENKIYYNYNNTGKDGTIFDCCQLVYLSKSNCVIKTSSDKFICNVNDVEVTKNDIEQSYLTMINFWLTESPIDLKVLWDLKIGLEMTQMCIDLIGKNSHNN